MDGIAAILRRHECVGLDTSPFIYHIEGASRYATAVGIVFDELVRGTFAGVTSVLTLMELTVKPLQLGLTDVADEYEMILSTFPNSRLPDSIQQRPAAPLNCAPPIGSVLPTRYKLPPSYKVGRRHFSPMTKDFGVSLRKYMS